MRVRLPSGAETPVERVTFAPDGATLDVVREKSSTIERYDLAKAVRVPASEAAPAPESPAPLAPFGEVTIACDAAERLTLQSVAKEIGGSTRDADGAVVLTSPTGDVGSDGHHFVWFDGPRGATLVRLDTGKRASFQPWTTGMSGLGSRTGGSISFAFGPNVDRAVVASVSQMGANTASDDPRLVDTRTMKVVGSLPSTCQPFEFTWSSDGAFVARRECWTGRLQLSDGVTAAYLRGDEPFDTLAFSTDGSLIAGRTLDGGLLVEQTKSGAHVLRTKGPMQPSATDLVFSPDGKRLLVARGNAIDVWNLETGVGAVVDTRAYVADVLVTDADATAAWIDARWLALDGPAPTAAPAAPASPKVGGKKFDPKKLANRDEGYDVKLVLPRPGTNELLVVGERNQPVSVMDEQGTMFVGRRFAIVDATSGVVEHVYDDDTLDGVDWMWTADGAHLITRANGALAVLSADLRVQSKGEAAIPVQPTQPLNRLVSMFTDVDGIVAAAKLLAATDVAPIEAPRAVHPTRRFVAFVTGPTVLVVDRQTGKRIALSCTELGASRGCLAVAEDGRWSATPALAPLLVREGETREQGDLVQAFFRGAP